MTNKFTHTVYKETDLTKFRNGIINGAQKKDQWVTLSDLCGFVRCFQCVYTPTINVKIDSENNHLTILENQVLVSAIVLVEELQTKVA
jgi:hypothetical protein